MSELIKEFPGVVMETRRGRYKLRSVKVWFFFLVPTLIFIAEMVISLVLSKKFFPFTAEHLVASWLTGGVANVAQKKLIGNGLPEIDK